jgi:Tfp pilus assembly protein PilF
MSAPAQSGLSGRPILSLSLALNYALGGYKVFGYHVFNLAVHILAALTLYGIVRRTLLCERFKKRFGNYAAFLAWIIAAIWLVHPIQTESVTYIIQRAESLMGFFYLLTLYLAITAMQSHRPLLWSVLSVVCCGLGMGTKEVMVTAPVLVLLYDRMFVAGSFVAALRRRWFLYIGLAGTWGILAVPIWSGPRSFSAGFSVGYKPTDYAMNQCIVILYYIRLAFWPRPLCLDYGWPLVNDWGRILPSMLVVSGMLAVTVWGVIRNRTWSYPTAWFFAVLAPTSSFVPIGDLAFEHRMYLPLAGLVVLMVLGGYVFLERRPAKGTGLVLAVIIIGALTVATLLRNNDYRTATSIWQTVVAAAPANPRGYYNLGSVLQDQGKLDDAINHYQQAIRLKSDHALARVNLGIALSEQGRTDEAISYLQQALQIVPDFAEAHNNLGIALGMQNRFSEAVSHYQQAINLKPDWPLPMNGLAWILATYPDPNMRDAKQAIALAERAASLTNYQNAIILNTLAAAYAAKDRFSEAIATAQKALDIAVAERNDYLAEFIRRQVEIYKQGRFPKQ